MSYAQIGEAVAATFKAMAVALCVFVPLGLWKFVEIVVWVFRHVSFGVTP